MTESPAPLPFPSKTSRAFIAGLLLGIILTFAAFMAFGPEPEAIESAEVTTD